MTARRPSRPSRRHQPHGRRHLGEGGFLAGSDGVLFGVLVLVTGTLLLVNAWSIVEHHVALGSAATEYLRAYTEQSDEPTARLSGTEAAQRLLRERGTPMSGLSIEHPDPSSFGPCAAATVRLSAVAAGIRLPFLSELTDATISITRTELVDPHREMIAGIAHDLDATPCGR